MTDETYVLETGDLRLRAANVTDWPEIARILASPDAVRELAREGQAGHLVSLLSALDAERLTEVLSAPDVVDELARHGQVDALLRFVSALSKAEQTRVLSAPLAVDGLVRTKAAAARVLLLIEALEPDQRASIWATPEVAHPFLALGFEARVLPELDRLPAQLASALGSGFLCWLVRSGYLSRVVRWLSALTPEERCERLANNLLLSELASHGQRMTVIQWLSELEPPERMSIFARSCSNLRSLTVKATQAELESLSLLLVSRGEHSMMYHAQRALVGGSRIERVLEFLEGLPDPLPFAYDPFSLHLAELADRDELNTPSTVEVKTLWRAVMVGAQHHLHAARIIALVRRLSPQQQCRLVSPSGFVSGLVRGGGGDQVLGLLESLPAKLCAAWLMECRDFPVLVRDAPSRTLALMSVLSIEEQLDLLSFHCDALPPAPLARFFELIQTVSPNRRAELLCKTEVASALACDGYDAAVVEWLLAMPHEQRFQALMTRDAASALVYVGRADFVIRLIEALTVVERAQVLSNPALLSQLVNRGRACAGFRLLSGLELAGQAMVLDALHLFDAFLSGEHQQLAAEWRARLASGAPSALRIGISSD